MPSSRNNSPARSHNFSPGVCSSKLRSRGVTKNPMRGEMRKRLRQQPMHRSLPSAFWPGLDLRFRILSHVAAPAGLARKNGSNSARRKQWMEDKTPLTSHCDSTCRTSYPTKAVLLSNGPVNLYKLKLPITPASPKNIPKYTEPANSPMYCLSLGEDSPKTLRVFPLPQHAARLLCPPHPPPPIIRNQQLAIWKAPVDSPA